MPVRYEVGAVGGAGVHKHKDYAPARADIRDRMLHARYAPVELKPSGSKVWSRERTVPDAMDRIDDLMRGNPGSRVTTRSAERPEDRRFYIVKKWVELSKGATVVKIALTQLGVDYNWAWADPRGDGDGEAGFDCSGLTSWVYSQVGVYLPHSAVATAGASNVQVFRDKGKLRKGDLIFYDASDRPSPNHIGIYAGEDQVIDASTYYDAVVRRPMDSNPIVAFGRVKAVNGPL